MAFDFDAAVKPSVHEPLDRLAANLGTKGAGVAFGPRYGVATASTQLAGRGSRRRAVER